MVYIKNRTTIELKKQTRDRLALLGRKGQTFDDLVTEILNHSENCDRWWGDNR